MKDLWAENITIAIICITIIAVAGMWLNPQIVKDVIGPTVAGIAGLAVGRSTREF